MYTHICTYLYIYGQMGFSLGQSASRLRGGGRAWVKEMAPKFPDSQIITSGFPNCIINIISEFSDYYFRFSNFRFPNFQIIL